MRLESTFEAFRTYKGEMTRGIYVQYAYANPDDPEKTRVVDENRADVWRRNDLRAVPAGRDGHRQSAVAWVCRGWVLAV